MIYRPLLRAVATAICISMALGMAGCGNRVSAVPSAGAGAGNSRPLSYTAQQLFEGLFYGEGAAANVFPEWWGAPARRSEGLPNSLTAAQHARLIANMHTFESEVGKIDPSFFGDFKREVTSGDPVRVSSVLQRLQHDAEAIAAMHDIDWKALASKARPDISTQVYKNAYVYDNVAALNQAVYAQVVAAQQYAVAWTAVYVIAIVAAVVVIPLDTHGPTDYSQDATVVLITKRLAGV